MTTYHLSRTPASLDDAMYSASCFAGNATDRCATVLMYVEGRREYYRVEFGRVGPFRDNATGEDWEPIYVVESIARDK